MIGEKWTATWESVGTIILEYYVWPYKKASKIPPVESIVSTGPVRAMTFAAITAALQQLHLVRSL